MNNSQNLLSTLNQLKSCEENTAQLLKARGGLCMFVDSVLGDLDRVSEDLSSQGTSSQSFMCLQLLRHYIETFVPNVVQNEDTPSLSQEEKDASEGLTFWLMSHLLRLLSHDRCSASHQTSCDIIIMLMQVVRLRRSNFFVRLLGEILLSLLDLFRISHTSFSEPQVLNAFKTSPALEKSFQEVISVSIQPRQILISSATCCETIQYYITKILSPVLDEVVSLGHYEVSILWKLMSCQVENCGSKIKKVSLDILNSLLASCSPSPPELGHFLSCVVCILERCSTSTGQVDREMSQVTETAVSSVRALLSQDCEISTITTLLTNQIVTSVNPMVIQVVCEAVLLCYRKDSQSVLNILPLLAETVQRHHLGHFKNAEFVVEVICMWLLEFKKSSKREVYDRRVSLVQQQCYKLCQDLSSVKDQDDIQCKLEGVCVLLKVLAESECKTIDWSIVYAAWKKCMLSCDKHSYEKILKSIGHLALFKDALEIPDEVLVQFAMIASCPRLHSETSFHDLHHGCVGDMPLLNKALSEELGHCLAPGGVHALAFFPKYICPQWRIHLYKLALNEARLQSQALKSFPYLLHNSGPTVHQVIYECIHPLVGVPVLKTCLISLVGFLACGVSRRTTLMRHNFLENAKSKKRDQLCSLVCTYCDKHEEGRPHFVNPGMFLPFACQLSDRDETVRIACIRSFGRLFSHIKVRADNEDTLTLLDSCLKLVEDESHNVRLALSCVIGDFVGDCENDMSSKTDEIIVSKLKTAYSTAVANGDIRLQESVVLTLGRLSRVSSGELLLVVIISLLDSMLSLHPLIASTAYHQVQALGRHKGIQTHDLYLKYKEQICRFVSDALHSAVLSGEGRDCNVILTEISQVFSIPDVKTFIQFGEKYLLPFLVMKASPAASSVIKLFAKKLGCSRKKLLITNTKHIFRHIICYCSKTDLEMVLHYLQKETEIEVASLLRLDYQKVLNELLVALGSHRQQVFNGLAMLASKDEQWKGAKNIARMEDLADFLQPRLLGILAYFDSHLLNASVPLKEKKLTLESLMSIMDLMGQKHITSVRVKIMTTLRICLCRKEPLFLDLNCKAWDKYVHSVDLPAIGPMLAQILVTLLPLLYKRPRQIADVFSYLVIDHRKELQQYFHELYFIPDIPELKEVNAVIKMNQASQSYPDDLATLLSHSLKGVAHESVDVRQHALSQLKQLLRGHQCELQHMLSGSDMAHPIISKMVSVLLNSCLESEVVLGLIGECLGELGAMDPAKLDPKSGVTQKKSTKFQASVSDEMFAHELVLELARSFLSAEDTRTQDCSAFALQELLQIYGIQAEGGANSALWARFPEHIQEILSPLLTSKYLLSSKHDWSSMPKPIHMSRKGNTFRDWVCNWTGFVASKVKEVKASRVFSSCSAVLKHDLNIVLFLLPHIVVYALLDGSDTDKAEIVNEITSVLKHIKNSERPHGRLTDFLQMSAQTIFSILDHARRWQLHRLQSLTAAAVSSRKAIRVDVKQDQGYACVTDFLERVPKDMLSSVSHSCKAYTRALMYCEEYVKTANLQEHLDFVQQLYVALEEPDGVDGVTAVRSDEPSLAEQVLAHQSTGMLRDASACYERAIQLEPNECSHHQGLLKCLLDLGQLSTALVHATGVLADKPSWSKSLNTYRVETAWRLGNWDKLETFLKTESNLHDWSIGVGQLLLSAKTQDLDEFSKQMNVLRIDQMGPLSAASMEIGAYQRAYENVVRLHMLKELEEGVDLMTKVGQKAGRDEVMQLMRQWNTRSQYVQYSFRVQEPVLTLRRALLRVTQDVTGLDTTKEVGQLWLQSARVARKAGHLQTAYSSILNASHYDIPELSVEKAKWLWDKGDKEQAFSCLQKGVLSRHSVESSEGNLSMEKVTLAKAMLLVARYSEDMANAETNMIVKKYKDVIDMHPHWEDGYFHLAKFYDKIMTTLTDREKPDKQGQFMIHVIQNFGLSLQHGSQYIYQSMPRLLSLWLDYGSSVVDMEKKCTTSQDKKTFASLQAQRTVIKQLNRVVKNFSAVLAPYQFLTAFPQLISRICHSHVDVSALLQDIVANLLSTFPQQAAWNMMSVSKSSYQVRANRCHQIFDKAKRLSPDLSAFLQQATKLVDYLLDLCNKPVEGHRLTMSISQDFRSLKRFLEDSCRGVSRIMLPLQFLMTVTLPLSTSDLSNYDPFPATPVFIDGIEDTVEVLPSLQKPKKITIRGSDGTLYPMMCKPKDDLRKDCRLMEFNSIVNKLLWKNPESRKRQLNIRTYTVVPLNEECGLLEWVPNTSGLRHILLKLYKEKGLYMHAQELMTHKVDVNASNQMKLNAYKRLLSRHPPVFGEWFVRTFDDPTSWYLARLSYCRTSAVISMVGYILGLGDRHGENILLDSQNGDTVHVDFNCLFNKGETFDYPEVVPFRLTHNMIDAMGPMGFEGIFRRACEVTLKVMREESDPLMSVLMPFIFDPLVEWSKPSRSRSSANESGEVTNEKAMTHVQNIEHRLQGLLKTKTRGLPLSVEGHVNHLIQAATNEELLSKMYIGWAAYL